MLPRPKTARSKLYLDYIRSRPCCVTGKQTSVEAAHVRICSGAGTGQKPSDFWTLPLDSAEHRRQHDIGERSFWAEKRRDPHHLIQAYLLEYIMKHHVRKELAVIEALERFIASELE